MYAAKKRWMCRKQIFRSKTSWRVAFCCKRESRIISLNKEPNIKYFVAKITNTWFHHTTALYDLVHRNYSIQDRSFSTEGLDLMSMRTVWLCRVLSKAFIITVMIKASKPDCQQKLKNITMTLDNGNESHLRLRENRLFGLSYIY